MKQVVLTASRDPQCKDCVYLHTHGYCDYFAITGRTRMSQNGFSADGLNSPCRERKVRTGHGVDRRAGAFCIGG